MDERQHDGPDNPCTAKSAQCEKDQRAKVEYLPWLTKAVPKLDHLYVVHGIPIPMHGAFHGQRERAGRAIDQGFARPDQQSLLALFNIAFAGSRSFPSIATGPTAAQFGRSMATLHSGDSAAALMSPFRSIRPGLQLGQRGVVREQGLHQRRDWTRPWQ